MKVSDLQAILNNYHPDRDVFVVLPLGVLGRIKLTGLVDTPDSKLNRSVGLIIEETDLDYLT